MESYSAESSKSSAWRGLNTAVLTLSAFALEFQGKKKKEKKRKELLRFTDNTSVVSVVHNGSRAVELQSPVLSIFSLLRHFRCFL